jgi:hypothetical protein
MSEDVGMASEPWFKFFAADYLLDAAVDSLPLEAQAVLLRMWCFCHIDGSCPADPKEIARKTRLSFEPIAAHLEQLRDFFDQRDGRFYSHRMEEEKAKSDSARRNGHKRGEQIRSANRLAVCSADRLAQSQSQRQNQNQNQNQSQSQSQSQSLPPSPSSKEGFHFSLQEKNGKSDFSQSDFDERDLRQLRKAEAKFEQLCRAKVGTNLPDWMHDEGQVELWLCAEAGISPKRGLELRELQRQSPQRAQEASA